MSSDADNYDEDSFDSHPQPIPAPQPPTTTEPLASTTSTKSPLKPPSRESTSASPLSLPAAAVHRPISPLSVSAQPPPPPPHRPSVRNSRLSHSTKGAPTPTSTKKKSSVVTDGSNLAPLVAQLQEWNDQLTQQTTAQTATITALEQRNAEVESSTSSYQRQIDDLTSQLQTLTTTYTSLKAQHTANLTSIAKLEAANVDLLSGHLKEKNQRVDLETRLSKCEAALRREREDCQRMKAERREKDVAGKVEDEQWEQEKRGWRETNVDLLSRLEGLTDSLQHHKHSEAVLQHQITALHSTLAARDADLLALNEQLVTAIRRANEHADAALAAQSTITRLEEQAGERGQVVLELERTVREQKEAIRGQSDRINSVVFQMGRMDEWKVVKEEEEREKAAVMIEMRGVVESQEKAMNTALISKERSDSMIGILEDRLGKEGKRMQEMRDKATEVERHMKAVVQALREKEAEFDHLAIKFSHVSSKWGQEQQLRAQERKTADGVERRCGEQREQLEGVLVERQRLEDEKVVKEELLRDLQVQVDAFKQKDESYKKIQHMLAASNTESSQALLALLTSNNERYVRYTNPVTKGKLKTALLTGAGQRVKAMLRRCEVDPKELLDWCIEPQRMVDGLHALTQNIKQLRNTEAFGGRQKPSQGGEVQVVGGGGGEGGGGEGVGVSTGEECRVEPGGSEGGSREVEGSHAPRHSLHWPYSYPYPRHRGGGWDVHHRGGCRRDVGLWWRSTQLYPWWRGPPRPL